jgi:hypothetical protein
MTEHNFSESHHVPNSFTEAELADPLYLGIQKAINDQIRQMPVGLTAVFGSTPEEFQRALDAGLTPEQIEWTIQQQHCAQFVTQGVERASIIPSVEEFDNGTKHYVLSAVVLSDQQFVALLENIVRGVVNYLRLPVKQEEGVHSE